MNVCSFFMVVPFLETGMRGRRSRVRGHGEVNHLIRRRRERVAELVLQNGRALQRERVRPRCPVSTAGRIELESLVAARERTTEVRRVEHDWRGDAVVGGVE